MLLKAKMTMISIDKFKARFRVTNHEGNWADGMDIHHVDVARKKFPNDDDFNLDFINADIDASNLQDLDNPVDDKTIEQMKKHLKKKQKAFKNLTEYTITIE